MGVLEEAREEMKRREADGRPSSLEEAARAVDALLGGDAGRWTYAGRRIADEAAEPLLIMHDELNTLSALRSAE